MLKLLVNQAKYYFGDEFVALMGFGSYFVKNNFLKGEGDIDIAIILDGKLTHSNFNKIKNYSSFLNEHLSENYIHAPFYSFVDEPLLTNPFLYKLFFEEKNYVKNPEKLEKLRKNIDETLLKNEPIALSLSKEHTHFARRCLIDNVLFDDSDLTLKIYKNHTTTAMRMMTYILTGHFLSNSYDVWKNWLDYTDIIKTPNSYDQIIKNLKEESFKLDVHLSLVDSIKNYEIKNGNKRYI